MSRTTGFASEPSQGNKRALLFQQMNSGLYPMVLLPPAHWLYVIKIN